MSFPDLGDLVDLVLALTPSIDPSDDMAKAVEQRSYYSNNSDDENYRGEGEGEGDCDGESDGEQDARLEKKVIFSNWDSFQVFSKVHFQKLKRLAARSSYLEKYHLEGKYQKKILEFIEKDESEI